MLSVTSNSSNRLDIEFSGKIDSAEMSAALDKMVELSADFDDGLLLYRIGKFEIPTLGAIGVELSRMPQLFRLLGRISKVAVICEQEWLQTIAEIEGKLIPNLEIKAFDLDDEDDAEEWLAGIDDD